MELVIEFLFELLIEGSIMVGTNKKVSKWIRYPLLTFVLLLYLSLIALFVFLAVSICKTNLIGGLLVSALLMGVIIIILLAFRNKYKEYKKGL